MNKYFKIILIFVSCGALITSGVLLEKSRTLSKTAVCGALRIDQSEADEPPKLFLELGVPIEQLKTLKTASFKVVDKNYIYAN